MSSAWVRSLRQYGEVKESKVRRLSVVAEECGRRPSCEEDASKIPLKAESVVVPCGVDAINPPSDRDYENVPYCYKYMKDLQVGFIVKTTEMVGDDQHVSRNRGIVVDWIISLIHYFHFSQETLYHTVSLIDRTLLVRCVSKDTIQLLGVGALFLASKLEEYYPPELKVLASLSHNESYTEKEILEMEKMLLTLHNFKVYGVDSMIFMNRFIQAAKKSEDKEFTHIVTCLYDTLLIDPDYSEFYATKLSAAAVCVALHISHTQDNNLVWNKTMEYYTEYTERELYPICLRMLTALHKMLTSKSKSEKYYSLKLKYTSQSLHCKISKSSKFDESIIDKSKLYFINTYEPADKS